MWPGNVSLFRTTPAAEAFEHTLMGRRFHKKFKKTRLRTACNLWNSLLQGIGMTSHWDKRRVHTLTNGKRRGHFTLLFVLESPHPQTRMYCTSGFSVCRNFASHSLQARKFRPPQPKPLTAKKPVNETGRKKTPNPDIRRSHNYRPSVDQRPLLPENKSA